MALWALTRRMSYIASLQAPPCEDEAAIILQGVLRLNPRLNEPAPLLPTGSRGPMGDTLPEWTYRIQTALFAAASSGLTNLVTLLLDAGANPDGVQGYRQRGSSVSRPESCSHYRCLLEFALANCHVPSLLMTAAPVGVSAADVERMWWYGHAASFAPSSPLDVAVQRNQHEVAMLLLNRTSPPSQQLAESAPHGSVMADAWLSVVAATHHGRTDIVRALLKRPWAAEVLSKGCNQDGPVIGVSPLTWSPLLFAASYTQALELE